MSNETILKCQKKDTVLKIVYRQITENSCPGVKTTVITASRIFMG